MEMYEGNYLTDEEMGLFWNVLIDAEDEILKLIETKNSTVGTVFYEGLTIVFHIDSEGDAIIEHITETISIESIESAD